MSSSSTSAWPAGYVPVKQCREYFERECRLHPDREQVVGRPGAWGTRWRHGPFVFEKYTTDEEPRVDPSGPWRYVIWQPLARRDPPPGWRTARLPISQRRGGLADLRNGKGTAAWASAARRQLKHWGQLVEAGGWETTSPGLEEFLAAFRHAAMRPDLRSSYERILKEKALVHGQERLRFFVARPVGGPVAAGLVGLDVPEARQSVHLIAFMTKAARGTPSGVAVVAAWLAAARAAGYEWLDFGNFWAPGEPRDWQGFSRFKSQFVTHHLDYPPPFTRLAGTWSETVRGWRRGLGF